MWRFSGWLRELVSCENWYTDGSFLKEVWTHLHIRVEFITCNFLSYNICSFMLSLTVLHILWVVYRAVNPLSLQILRMGRWCHNAQPMMSFLQKCAKRCCWNCNIWPDWFTCHQSCYCLYYFNGIAEFIKKRFNVNKIAQTT